MAILDDLGHLGVSLVCLGENYLDLIAGVLRRPGTPIEHAGLLQQVGQDALS